MSDEVYTISEAGDYTPWVEFRGSSKHEFTMYIGGTFSATVTLQARKHGSPTVVDLEDHTVPIVANGDIFGDWDLRLIVKAGNYSSGSVECAISS